MVAVTANLNQSCGSDWYVEYVEYACKCQRYENLSMCYVCGVLMPFSVKLKLPGIHTEHTLGCVPLCSSCEMERVESYDL